MAYRNTLIDIHSIIPSSRVNGPGTRMVIFFQGCGKDCPGCFNPELKPFGTGKKLRPGDIFTEHPLAGLDGITVSGGEPFDQPQGLMVLLKRAVESYGLSTVVYTGYTIEELSGIPECEPSLNFIDVLIDGRYNQSRKEPTTLARGSTNQCFCYLSSRYEESDFYMPGKAEVIIGKDGTVTRTGFYGRPDSR